MSEISSLFPPSRFLFGCCPGLDVPARQQNPTSGMGNQTFGMHAWAWQKFETTEHQPNRMPAGSMSTLRLSAVDPCEVLPPVWDHLCLLALRRFLKLWSTTVRRIRYSPIPKAVNNRFFGVVSFQESTQQLDSGSDTVAQKIFVPLYQVTASTRYGTWVTLHYIVGEKTLQINW